MFKGLFLNVQSLERLIHCNNTQGCLDDVIFAIFATVLNFSLEYDPEKKKIRDVLPNSVLGDTQDNVNRLNPKALFLRVSTSLRNNFSSLNENNRKNTR